MKKPKQKELYEDKSDPMGGLDMQLDEDDDDIIDLEDIIEMPDRPIDEDEDLDLDVAIFDVDEELQSPPEVSARKASGPSTKEGPREVEDENLLESLAAEPQEDDLLFEPTASGSTGKASEEKAKPQISDEEEEFNFDLDDLLAESELSESPREKQPSLKERAEAALKFTEEARSEEGAADHAPAAAPANAAGASVSEISAAAEELVGRIESHLQEHIRAVVESMLPGLVRSIIDEEIRKLKQELE